MMMSEREFVDGAFYWVRPEDDWLVARYNGGSIWSVTGLAYVEETAFFTEIGPMIGMEPPTWQPMATVPKDGTVVYLTDGERVQVASWHRFTSDWGWAFHLYEPSFWEPECAWMPFEPPAAPGD